MYWKSLDLFRDSYKIPLVSCVYAFYFNGELVYIGSTINLKARLISYRFRIQFGKLMTKWGIFDIDTKVIVKYRVSVKYAEWLMVEARLIKRLQPKYNISLKKGTHHEMV